MSTPLNGQAWLTGKSDNRRFALAFAVGLLLEAGVLAILLPIMTRQAPPPADTQTVVKLSILAPSPPAPPAPPPPKHIMPPVKPVAPPPPLPPPPPLSVAPPMPLPPPPLPMAPNRPAIHPKPRPRHITPPPVQPPPVVQAQKAPTPPPPAAAPPAAPSAGELDMFRAAMQRAVQQAARMPAAAAMAQEAGVARVHFIYRGGSASDIEIIGSSGYPILDEAARQAVRDAALPPPPADFADAARGVTVDVIFRAVAASTDGD